MSADDTDTIDYFKSRGIAREAAFFLPHVKDRDESPRLRVWPGPIPEILRMA